MSEEAQAVEHVVRDCFGGNNDEPKLSQWAQSLGRTRQNVSISFGYILIHVFVTSANMASASGFHGDDKVKTTSFSGFAR